MQLSGTLAPLPTPFTDDGASISEVRLLRLMERVAGLGAAGYVVGTAVGEAGTIGYQERKKMLELVLRSTQLPVLSDVTSLSTAASLDLAQHAGRHGARACLLAPPFGCRYTEAEVFGHFRTIAQHAGLSVIACAPLGAIGPTLAQRLADLPALSLAKPNAWSVRLLGATGGCASHEFAYDQAVATALALLVPVVELAQEETAQVDGLCRLLEVGGPARTVKAAYEIRGLELGPLRGPLLPLAPEIRAALESALTRRQTDAAN